MAFIEQQYIEKIKYRFEKLTEKNKVYQFRCPYCGDSQKSKSKARGYLYPIGDTYNYRCHNCGKSISFLNFLKDTDSSQYEQFLLEKFKGSRKKKKIDSQRLVTPPPPEKKVEEPILDIFSDLIKLSDLPKNHLALKYIQGRKIPETKYKEIYFCREFKKWTNSIKPTFDKLNYDESRIIIPLIYNKKAIGFVGRSLNPNSKVKYITILFSSKYPKIYNLDSLNLDKDTYILEGPFDSMFVPNSIAMCGSDVNLSEVKITNPVYVYDNEPRNLEIVKRMEKVIDSGNSIVIWPNSIQEKDINLMYISGVDILKTLRENTFTGLTAKLKFNYWKRKAL
jgi:transcription elongation factor Elf1